MTPVTVGKVCALTGAGGYVGSILRRRLESEGFAVLSLTRREVRQENEIGWSLDTRQDSLVDELQERGVSALLHAAWDLDLVRPKDLERVNVQGSLRLLDRARTAGVLRRVFVSTISAFEGAQSHYGRTKLAVERAVLAEGGIVIRPGLVFGDCPGGMFGAIRSQVRKRSVIPLLGDGHYPQYLIHENDLAAAVVRALSIEDPPPEPVTVAHPQPWPLRSLIEEIARGQGRTPHFIPVPWPLIYGGLKFGECLGMRLGFHSDSVTSLIHPNPRPELNAGLLGVEPRPFAADLPGDLGDG